MGRDGSHQMTLQARRSVVTRFAGRSAYLPPDSASSAPAIAAPVRHERIRLMVALGWVIGYRPPWVSRTWAVPGLPRAGGLVAPEWPPPLPDLGRPGGRRRGSSRRHAGITLGGD